VVAVLDSARPAGTAPPALAGWADLDEREAAAGIQARHPILIDPEFRVDRVLAGFLPRSRFAWLADGTREAYAKDYRLFFSFLWQRGKYWHEADPDDLLTGNPGGAAARSEGGSAAASGSGSWPRCGCYMSGRKRKGASPGARCWCARCGCGTAAQ
jgi:hypothetical protein